ncbi:MAG: hypothetical protein HY362_00380 [Candidatus Aenigmarchaeota archaeon]|nr:hypothetical protein [Candidatus Aenigmarchaeota archaeon]
MSFKERIGLWKDVLQNPKETFAKTLKKGTLEDGVIHTVLSSGISSILFGIILIMLFLLSPTISESFASSMGLPSMSGIVGAAVFMVLLVYTGYLLFYFTVTEAVSLLLSSGIVYLLAKNMGGTGTYGKQTFLLALVQAPIRIGLYLFMLPLLLGSILIKTSATIGLILFAVGGLGVAILALLSIVYQIRAMKIAHKVKTSTAAIALLLPLIVLLILAGIIIVFVAMAYSAAGGAGISPQSMLI